MFPVSLTLSSDVLRKVLSSFRGGIAGVVLCSCISIQQASKKSSWRDTAKDSGGESLAGATGGETQGGGLEIWPQNELKLDDNTEGLDFI